MNVEIMPNRSALTTVRNKKKELNDLDEHAYEAGADTDNSVVEALVDVDELEKDLRQNKRIHVQIKLRCPDCWQKAKRSWNVVLRRSGIITRMILTLSWFDRLAI